MKKDTVGIIRTIDRLGRLVIPKEFRDMYKLDKEVEIVATTDGVLIRSSKHKIVLMDIDDIY